MQDGSRARSDVLDPYNREHVQVAAVVAYSRRLSRRVVVRMGSSGKRAKLIAHASHAPQLLARTQALARCHVIDDYVKHVIR